MSEMSSFYGGRQGSSFVIVKRFDGIDIPQIEGEEIYTNDFYAYNGSTSSYILTTKENGGNVEIDAVQNIYLIKKTGANKDNYSWMIHNNDGARINATSYNFPIQLAEGMVQCFSKGAMSSSEVGYGEYVLIDTITNLHDANNPDSGKIYRRGLDISTDLAGAEYIGCIAGPEGAPVEIDYGHYDDIIQMPTLKGSGIYNMTTDDLVPGIHYNGSTPVYEDNIYYAYATLQDSYGNIKTSLLGFKLPTLVQEYEGTSITPYTNRRIDPNTGKYYNYDLVTPDNSQYIDNQWQHSFYQKWQIKIPCGYHGIDITNLEIVPTKTMPQGFKADDFEGTKYYSNKNLTTLLGTFTTAQTLDLDTYNASENWASVIYNGTRVYVSKDDCYMDMFRYKETNYNNIEAGEAQYFLIGYVETIQRIALSPNGVLTVYYRGNNQSEELETSIQWVDNTQIQTTATGSNVEGTGDQKLHITYNTLNNGGQHKTATIGNPLNYIIETSISKPNATYPDIPYCHLLVYYADPALRNTLRDKWVTWPSEKYPGQVWTEWVDLGDVRGAAGGIHIVKDVQNISELQDSQGHDIPPERLEDDYGHIINSEAAGWSCSLTVWEYVETISTDPAALLIVSDETSPVLDNQIKISTVEALNPGQFHIGDYVKKEKAKPTEILFYDYNINAWYSVGSLDISGIDPRYIIIKSAPIEGSVRPAPRDVELLNNYGIWFSAENITTAY